MRVKAENKAATTLPGVMPLAAEQNWTRGGLRIVWLSMGSVLGFRFSGPAWKHSEGLQSMADIANRD